MPRARLRRARSRRAAACLASGPDRLWSRLALMGRARRPSTGVSLGGGIRLDRSRARIRSAAFAAHVLCSICSRPQSICRRSCSRSSSWSSANSCRDSCFAAMSHTPDATAEAARARRRRGRRAAISCAPPALRDRVVRARRASRALRARALRAISSAEGRREPPDERQARPCCRRARRAAPHSARRRALRAHESLDDAILERVEADHDETTAACREGRGSRERRARAPRAPR